MIDNYHTIVNILFGSRLYGTAIENSDYDYKIVYLPRIEDLILGKKKIYSSEQEKLEGTVTKVEYELMSLHKFLQLAKESQIMAIDMLWAPKNNIMNDSNIWNEIIKNREDFITKNIITFADYALNQAKKYGIKGSRLNIIKTLVDYLSTKNNNDKIYEYEDFFESIITEETKKDVILIDTEKDKRIIICGKTFPMNSKIKFMISPLVKYYETYGERAKLAEESNGVDFKAVSHAFRAIYQVEELLETNNIVFPLKQAEFLRDIKLKKYSYKVLEHQLEQNIVDIRQKIKNSNIKEHSILDWDNFILQSYDFGGDDIGNL